MKKIRISENELVELIEKLVKENIGNGTGFNFGAVGTPTSKYKDLYEDDDIEGDITEQIRIRKGKGFFDIDVTFKWPQLPQWLRRLFIKKHKNTGGKWLHCTIDKCPAWDGASTDEKKKVSDGIEGDEATEEEVTEVTLNVNVDDETQDGLNQEDFMESISESQLIKRLKGKLITEKKKKGKKDKTWIQKAYKSGDVKKDKLTDYCSGKVTCKCVERALKNKGMKKGAQMYLNMNKSKCKSLRD